MLKKISVFIFSTECLNIKYGEKVMKNWPEIRQSLNQKCLDKQKQYRKKNEKKDTSINIQKDHQNTDS